MLGKEGFTIIQNVYMRTFIEDYLANPAAAIASAVEASENLDWAKDIDEEIMYSQISSPEFKMYETLVKPLS